MSDSRRRRIARSTTQGIGMRCYECNYGASALPTAASALMLPRASSPGVKWQSRATSLGGMGIALHVRVRRRATSHIRRIDRIVAGVSGGAVAATARSGSRPLRSEPGPTVDDVRARHGREHLRRECRSIARRGCASPSSGCRTVQTGRPGGTPWPIGRWEMAAAHKLHRGCDVSGGGVQQVHLLVQERFG